MSLVDPIVMFHPDVPSSVAWEERTTFREHWYPRGWRSNDDAYAEFTHLTPGVQVDVGDINADGSTFSAAGEIVGPSSRVTLPLLGQPILLTAEFQLASVTSASTFSLAVAKLADAANALGYKGARQFTSVPINGTAGVGTTISLAYIVPANTPATDWTLCGVRDSGTGTGQVKANAIFGGFLLAEAK